jgi:putative MATE family efflux protein
MNKDDKKRYLILKDPNIIKGLFILSLPLMFNNILRTFHDIVDMYFVGQIEDYGNEAIAAIQITFPITFIYISLAMGLSIAGTALISQLYGANQLASSTKYATHLVIISLLLGVVLNVVAYFLAPVAMRLMGADGFALENATSYLQIRSFEMVFLFLFFAFTSVRQASGDTLSPVILGAIAMVLNIIFSPILIQVFDLGVSGAAYATLFSNVVIMPFGLFMLFNPSSGIRISLHQFKTDFLIVKELVTTALPASMGQAITAVGFAVLNGFIYSYGTDTVSAFGVGNRISSIFLHPVMAIGGVMAAYIGQNIGNLNPQRAKRAFREGMVLSIGLMTIGSIIGIFVREPIAKLFFDADEYALELSITYMFFLFLGLPLMAIYQAYIGAYNGNGKTIYTFLLGVIRLWALRIPLIYSFGRFTNLGSSGIWYAMLISNFIIAFLGFIFFLRMDFKPRIEIDPKIELEPTLT